jgi:hypothetical protein
MPRLNSLSLLCLVIVLCSAPREAEANGQTTHVWITEQALDHIEDPELAALLRSPEMRDPLLNGTMFPDGGYAINDDYGEIAHWEPFQQSYLAWIRENLEPPWNEGEASGHVAFLMGLGSHGLADEVFDSLFMERSRVYDPGWSEGTSNLDTASDVLFAAEVGGIVPPESWLPTEALLPIFNDVLNYQVEGTTLESGQNLLFSALAFTEWARTDEGRLATFRSEFPWTAENLINVDVPGSPLREATVVARYWEDLWRRLHSPEPWDQPILEFIPGAGTHSHATDATTVEARLHLSFSRGVASESLAGVIVSDSQGSTLPITVEHHYRDFSHAVHVFPLEDWPQDEEIEISFPAGMMNFDGVESSAPWSASFNTGPPPLAAEELDCLCNSSQRWPTKAALPLSLFVLCSAARWRRTKR